MKITFEFDETKAKELGIEFDELNAEKLIYYVEEKIEELSLHNKNLTQRQYFAASDIAFLLKCITAEQKPTEKVYQVWQTVREFEECNELFETVRTANLEQSMNDFCEDWNDTAVYDIDDMTVTDDYGNEFKFVEVV